MSFIKPGRKPKRRGDRFGLMRAADVGNLPDLFKPKKGSKFADPEEILQDTVNQALEAAGQYQFRIPASVYQRANDKSITGWPDSPMITRLQPGLALLGPLELKKEGKTLSDGQAKLQPILGTVEADNWPAAWAYILWFRSAVEHVRRLLQVNPLPDLPAKPSIPQAIPNHNKGA
jgi:hypothetical protein